MPIRPPYSPAFTPGLEFHIDNVFLVMASAQGIRAGGLKRPYAVLHQNHRGRGSNARVTRISSADIANYLGVSTYNIEVGKPFTYSNPKWGLAGVDLPETCFIKGKEQRRPCFLKQQQQRQGK